LYFFNRIFVAMNECSKNIREAEPKYQALANSITERVPMSAIPVYAADIPNACATSNEYNVPIITYNPRFIKPLEYRNPWTVVMVFAHEVAHHYNEDLKSNSTTAYESRQQELNADEFAGYILRYEGASLSDSLSIFDIIEFERSATHPSEVNRRKILRKGWVAADREINPENYEQQQEFNPLPNILRGLAVVASVAIIFGVIAAIVRR